ncbi:MAG: NUDIX hydrolase [Candidatus Aenigmatarchaeota archaeon]
MKSPVLTVDSVIEINGKIVLIRRLANSFKGFWALPGGFVEYMETVENAAIREAKEETGLKIKIKRLIGVYSDPKRNPDKKHRVAVAFAAEKIGGKLRSGSDAGGIGLFSERDMKKMKLAFDHNKMIGDYFKQRTV